MLDECLARDPHDAESLELYATVFSLSGREDEAAVMLTRAIEAAPEDPSPRVALGHGYFRRGRVDVARTHALAALQLDPEGTDGLALMAHIHLRMGEIDEAREHAISALSIDPTHSGALNVLAGVKARQSFFLGLWWRMNSALTRCGERGTVLILVLMFLLYRVANVWLSARGYDAAANNLQYFWLAFCAYTWIAPGIFKRALERELSQVKLNPDY